MASPHGAEVVERYLGARSAWAIQPVKATGLSATQQLQPVGLEPWIETALFGTAAELKAQRDARLDPNSESAEGTNLPMMAGPDAAKMKPLSDRGADVRANAKSGFTALMVASTHLGSSESMKLLLEHGAGARPGEGGIFDASRCFSRPRPVTLIASPAAREGRRSQSQDAVFWTNRRQPGSWSTSLRITPA